ncbi:MAG TPA: outer membrane beta-barrel protein, partial [Dongiaceae bacterium]|nr:outer membrane beta-barrel protein [Dongiaceae bacterium]
LSRIVGNPSLGPKYTHSLSLDASWTGSRGTLRVSPYFRQTVDNWDQLTSVDTAGVATSTWTNASSVMQMGVSVTASLRQAGRLGGTVGVSLYRERHDASNVPGQVLHSATSTSANANLTFRTTKRLDLQGWLRYAPRQTLAQGTRSAYAFLMLGARFKLVGDRAWLSGWVRDPFDMAHWSQTTGDATYATSSTQRNSLRGASATLMWTWGKPPEQKPRRQSTDSQAPDAQGQGR